MRINGITIVKIVMSQASTVLCAECTPFNAATHEPVLFLGPFTNGETNALRNWRTRSRPRLLLLISLSRSGAEPRNLQFHRCSRGSPDSSLRSITLDIELTVGRSSVLLNAPSPGPAQFNQNLVMEHPLGISGFSCPDPRSLKITQSRTHALVLTTWSHCQ